MRPAMVQVFTSLPRYLTFFAYGQIYDVLADSNPSEPTFINVHGWHQGDQASNADKVME